MSLQWNNKLVELRLCSFSRGHVIFPASPAFIFDDSLIDFRIYRAEWANASYETTDFFAVVLPIADVKHLPNLFLWNTGNGELVEYFFMGLHSCLSFECSDYTAR